MSRWGWVGGAVLLAVVVVVGLMLAVEPVRAEDPTPWPTWTPVPTRTPGPGAPGLPDEFGDVTPTPVGSTGPGGEFEPGGFQPRGSLNRALVSCGYGTVVEGDCECACEVWDNRVTVSAWRVNTDTITGTPTITNSFWFSDVELVSCSRMDDCSVSVRILDPYELEVEVNGQVNTSFGEPSWDVRVYYGGCPDACPDISEFVVSTKLDGVGETDLQDWLLVGAWDPWDPTGNHQYWGSEGDRRYDRYYSDWPFCMASNVRNHNMDASANGSDLFEKWDYIPQVVNWRIEDIDGRGAYTDPASLGTCYVNQPIHFGPNLGVAGGRTGGVDCVPTGLHGVNVQTYDEIIMAYDLNSWTPITERCDGMTLAYAFTETCEYEEHRTGWALLVDTDGDGYGDTWIDDVDEYDPDSETWTDDVLDIDFVEGDCYTLVPQINNPFSGAFGGELWFPGLELCFTRVRPRIWLPVIGDPWPYLSPFVTLLIGLVVYRMIRTK